MSQLTCGAMGAEDSPVIVLTDERPPFEYTKKDGTLEGVATNVVRCAFEKAGLKYEIKVVPWKRAQSMVKDGRQGHAFYSASRNKERDEYAVLSATIADQYWNWYLLKDNPLNPDGKDFKKHARTASWFGSNSLQWLTQNGYKVVSTAKNTEMLIGQLHAKRIDAAFGSNIAMKEAIEKVGGADKIREVRGLHEPMGVYFSKTFLKTRSGLLEKFNAGVASCSK